jgi:hypothetical protein
MLMSNGFPGCAVSRLFFWHWALTQRRAGFVVLRRMRGLK